MYLILANRHELFAGTTLKNRKMFLQDTTTNFRLFYFSAKYFFRFLKMISQIRMIKDRLRTSRQILSQFK